MNKKAQILTNGFSITLSVQLDGATYNGKLVPADAVVLTVEDARLILWNMKNDRWDRHSMAALDRAIEQAKGVGNGQNKA